MRRRLLAWALIAYGLLGIALLVAGAATGLGLAARAERLAADADGTLAAASRALDAAAASFTSIDGSLSEAGRSADGAAELARRASTTLDALSVAMQLSILGTQPLLPLAADFSASADLAVELAGTLDEVGSSLSDTRDDVATIGAELDVVGRELAALRDSTGADGSAPPLRLFVGLLLAWLAVPAVGSLLAGVTLLGLRPRAAAGSVRRAQDAPQPDE